MINYKQVADKLELILSTSVNGINFWQIELTEYYVRGKLSTVIYLKDTGNANKYRLYHSELNDAVTNNKELFECCVESLREYLDDVKYVMVGMMNGCLIMMDEMEG